MASSSSREADKDMWTDHVFLSRQREIKQLTSDFETLMDKMLVNRPIVLDKKLLPPLREEEEEEEEPPPPPKIPIQQHALLLMREIDVMRQDTHRLIVWFRPSVTKANPRLKNLKNSLEQLYHYLESLRIRAEDLLSDE
jgi:hypothetical protein